MELSAGGTYKNERGELYYDISVGIEIHQCFYHRKSRTVYEGISVKTPTEKTLRLQNCRTKEIIYIQPYNFINAEYMCLHANKLRRIERDLQELEREMVNINAEKNKSLAGQTQKF